MNFTHSSMRNCDITSIRHLNSLNVVNFVDLSSPNRTDTNCFWSNLRVLRILHVTLHSRIRDCFERLLGLEQLYLVASVADANDAEANDIGAHDEQSTQTRLVHIDSSAMPRLHANTKLRLLDLSGLAIGSLAPDTFDTLHDVHRLTVRLRDTSVATLPGGLFYALHAISNLAIQVSDNRQLIGLTPNVFYANVSVWDAIGTRSMVGGLDVFGNAALGCDCGLMWLGHWLRRWLRETAQMNVVTKDEARGMLEVSGGFRVSSIAY